MSRGILFVGIDVDDNAYHVHLLGTDLDRGLSCNPSCGALVSKLLKFRDEGYELKLCYEATYLGFSLCRQLRKQGIDCSVIAPSSIPRPQGKRIKTDRIDSQQLAEFYRNGQLKTVHVPGLDDERIRDFVRTRAFYSKELRSLKAHIQSLLRRQGLNYREEEGKGASYWTQKHINWLKRILRKSQDDAFKNNLEILVGELEHRESLIERYDIQIERWAREPKFRRKVEALECFRGIATQTAMVLVTELGDIDRFDHPRRLTSFSGLDVSEASSGGKEKKFGITRGGNRHIRTAVVEACQYAARTPAVAKTLKVRRKGKESKFILIADRCMERLYKKGSRLKHREKPTNKVKVACAREMLGFVWEALKAAA